MQVRSLPYTHDNIKLKTVKIPLRNVDEATANECLAAAAANYSQCSSNSKLLSDHRQTGPQIAIFVRGWQKQTNCCVQKHAKFWETVCLAPPPFKNCFMVL